MHLVPSRTTFLTSHYATISRADHAMPQPVRAAGFGPVAPHLSATGECARRVNFTNAHPSLQTYAKAADSLGWVVMTAIIVIGTVIVADEADAAIDRTHRA